VGQTGLLLCLWGAMLFFWGMSLSGWARVLASPGAGFCAYEIFPHVHRRVDQYLSDSDTGYQAGWR
jgi:cell division protein FtsW (lipid II flippase)